MLVPFYKGKGDIKECGNYCGIKLTCHTMKLWERVIEARLRKEVRVAEQQFGFMPGRSTTDAIFSLRMLLEKWKEGQKGCTVCLWISKRPMIGCRGRNYGSVYAWPKHRSAM